MAACENTVAQIVASLRTLDPGDTGLLPLGCLRHFLEQIVDKTVVARLIDSGVRIAYEGFIQWVAVEPTDLVAAGSLAFIGAAPPQQHADLLQEAEVKALRARIQELEDEVAALMVRVRRSEAEMDTRPRASEAENSVTITSPNEHTTVARFSRTSLSRLAARFGAPIVMVSCPEYGLHRTERMVSGLGEFDAPVMHVLQNLPRHLKASMQTHIRCGEGVWRVREHQPTFSLGVDFAGSASAKLCNSRIRWIDDQGEPITGKSDFQRIYTRDSLEQEELKWRRGEVPSPLEEEEQMRAIDNSFWSLFWRGQVSGALLLSFMSAPDAPCSNHESNLTDLDDGVGVYTHQYIQGSTARVVIAASIEGGPVTRFEDRALPEVCKGVVSTIRRRGYTWGGHVYVLWCRFRTLEDFLLSLSGVPNLERDEHPQRTFMKDGLGRSTTFTATDCSELPTERYREQFLRSNLHDVMMMTDDNGPVRPERLAAAAKDGDIDGVEFLLKKAADMNTHTGSFQETPLMLAARGGYADVIEVLIKSRACIDLSGGYSKTALHLAAWAHEPEAVERLLSMRAEIDVRTDGGETPLNWAAGGAPPDGVEFRRKFEKGSAASAACVEALIANGADVNALTHAGMTPLHEAALIGRETLVLRSLLAGRADTTVTTPQGATAFGIAAARGHEEFMQLLAASGPASVEHFVAALFESVSVDAPVVAVPSGRGSQGADFALNYDGTVWCTRDSWKGLVVGMCEEGLCLVRHWDVARRLHFCLQNGEACDVCTGIPAPATDEFPLRLRSNRAQALVQGATHDTFEGAAVQSITLGAVAGAMQVRVDCLGHIRPSDNLFRAFDVDQGNMNEGTTVWLFTYHSAHNQSFKVNADDGSISPLRAPHLALGYREEKVVLVPCRSEDVLQFELPPEASAVLAGTGPPEACSNGEEMNQSISLVLASPEGQTLVTTPLLGCLSAVSLAAAAPPAALVLEGGALTLPESAKDLRLTDHSHRHIVRLYEQANRFLPDVAD